MCRQRRRSLGWGIFWLMFVGAIIAVSVVLSLRYAVPDDADSSKTFTSNETRIIDLSSTFCQSVTFEQNYHSSFMLEFATFYLLSEKPPLSDHDQFHVAETNSFSGRDYGYFIYWSFYLYPGSSISVSSCLDISSDVTFYLVQGENNYKKWKKNPSSHALRSKSVTDVCPNRKSNISFSVTDEDLYYLVYRLEDFESTPSVTVDMDFYRTKYELNLTNIITNCTMDLNNYLSKCTLDIPMEENVALISLNPYTDPDSIDWTSTADFDVYCVGRVWLYVIISVGTIGVIFLASVTIILLCCCYIRRNRRKYTPIVGEIQPATVTTVPAPSTATFSPTSQPPPYNPSYGGTATGQPPKYY